MLLTKDETIAEIETNTDTKNHVSCEAGGYSLHAAKLISVEPYFVETKETNDVGFKKSFMTGFFRLRFQEGDDVKSYEVDANPEEVNKIYYYVIKDGGITNIFPHKDDIKAYLIEHFNNNKSEEEDNAYPLLFIPMFMALPLAAFFSTIDMPFFFKMGLALTWAMSFIAILLSSSYGEDDTSDDAQKQLKYFFKEIDNIEE